MWPKLPFLDTSLPQFNWLRCPRQIYDEKEMLKGKLDLLSNTNMVDFAMDVHKHLYPDQDVPQSSYRFTHCLETYNRRSIIEASETVVGWDRFFFSPRNVNRCLTCQVDGGSGIVSGFLKGNLAKNKFVHGSCSFS